MLILQGTIGIASILLFNLGFLIMTTGVQNPGGLNKALLEYYRSKRICIVHRGPIKGKIFACTTCNVFYCQACRDAIAQAENKCWNCQSVLVNSLRIDIALKAGEPLFDAFQNIKNELKHDDPLDTLQDMIKVMGKLLDVKKGEISTTYYNTRIKFHCLLMIVSNQSRIFPSFSKTNPAPLVSTKSRNKYSCRALKKALTSSYLLNVPRISREHISIGDQFSQKEKHSFKE